MPIDIDNTTAIRAPALAELIIDDLALGESELRARVADLEADLVTYRELLQVAIEALADLTKTHERMRSSYYQLLDERRARHQDQAA